MFFYFWIYTNFMNTEPEIQDVDVVFKTTLKSYWKKIAIWVTVSLAWAALVLFFFHSSDLPFFIALAPLAGLIWYITAIREEILAKFYQQFAAANGYAYKAYDYNFRAEGALFAEGKDRQYSNIICGRFKEHPMLIFTYRYSTGSGKNKRTYHYTVFEIDYDRVLPKMFLRSDKSSWHMVKPDFNAGRRLKLDQNFDDKFDLFCEEKFEIEALQVFTPDIMHKLMTDWHKLSLEFVNDKIYIYAKHRMTKKQDLMSMYELGQYLIEKLAPVLARMEPSVIAMKEKF